MKCVTYLDTNNIFHRYKKLDFVQLLKYISSLYEVERITSYNAIDKSNQAQKKFTTYLSNNGYRCKVVDITEQTNIDNMLTTDMCSDSNTMDHKVIVLISGDGDYSYPLDQLANAGYKIHVIGPKENTSLQLLNIADIHTYLEDIPGVIINSN